MEKTYISFDHAAFEEVYRLLMGDLENITAACKHLQAYGLLGSNRHVHGFLSMEVGEFRQACAIWRVDPARCLCWAKAGLYLFQSQRRMNTRNLWIVLRRHWDTIVFWSGFLVVGWYLFNTVLRVDE